MDRKKWLGCVSGAAFIVLISWFSGCGGKSEGQNPSNNDGVSCASFNNNQEGCEKAKEKGKQCVFDEIAKTCSLPSDDNQGECSKKNPDECKDSDQCTFDITDNTCKDAEAGIKGTCASLQRDAACTAKNGCEWDGDTCIEKQSPKDIFTWTKASLPAGADHTEISQVVVSGDEAHIYAFSNKADGTVGLYHSSDDGATWLRVGKAANGVIEGLPFLGNIKPTAASLNTTATEPVIKATQGGIVVHSGKKLFILEGAEVKWGIDTAIHHDTINPLKYLNKTKDVKDENIAFVDIITTQAGQTIIFGQESANTVFFKDAAGAVSKGSAPKRFKTLTTAGADLNQVWVRAGNTHNNAHILLASAQGIWQFPVDHTNPINAGAYGKAGQDERVLFPEADADGVNWKDNNVSYNVIGSFDNGGTHHYFAGLTHNATGPIDGGFAHFNGIQAAGQHALLNFNNITVLGISRTGPMRLITSAGLKGINDDGTANPARDYSFATLAANKAEMMEDKSAVNEPEATDDSRARLFGNTNKTIWWIFDKGIFVRTKSQGQPRP